MARSNDSNGVQMDTWLNPKIWPVLAPLSGLPTGETVPASNVTFMVRRGPGEGVYNFDVKPGDSCKVFRDYRTIVPRLAPHLVLVDENAIAAAAQVQAPKRV
jgi:hypothetical protein